MSWSVEQLEVVRDALSTLGATERADFSASMLDRAWVSICCLTSTTSGSLAAVILACSPPSGEDPRGSGADGRACYWLAVKTEKRKETPCMDKGVRQVMGPWKVNRCRVGEKKLRTWAQ
ncbi:hypothetical protein NDU88_005477 [Pleurodeles waltl]|uniref:Uncharacterized protein n=1 Tax=Pleurodeles waltl TaxID=8319 RepID=A0AAV7TC54_PLEWA|nr:hypothetical protein NDU88_005477 [Pleurodeles waltl]